MIPLLLLLLMLAQAEPVEPAERLPKPEPERCLGFIAMPGDEDARPDGLTYEQIAPVLDAVLPTALHCPRPTGRTQLALTFALVIGCDGLISSIAVVDDDRAPEAYLQCVSSVIQRADFPAHDMAEGMPVTYPVNVRW
ncbi:MAG: hypothetical protein AAFV53_13020 [Myxococcota bacterium]